MNGSKAKLEEKFNEIKRQAMAKKAAKDAAAADQAPNDINDLSAPAPGLKQEQPDEFDAAQMEFWESNSFQDWWLQTRCEGSSMFISSQIYFLSVV